MAKLPILMYHDVTAGEGNGLTIGVEMLERQFAYLVENGYKTYHFKELLKLKKLPSKRNVVITFDDGYVSQLKMVVPLLKKYKLKASFFIPLNYLGKTDEWNTNSLPIMNSEQLHSLDPSVIELGFHSFDHKRYNELSEEEIEDDTQRCFEVVSENSLPFAPILAYPYGKYPRDISGKKQFIELLKKLKLQYGLRIGNRVNHYPFKNPFEIQRIDIKGEFTLKKFKRKIRFGKIF